MANPRRVWGAVQASMRRPQGSPNVVLQKPRFRCTQGIKPLVKGTIWYFGRYDGHDNQPWHGEYTMLAGGDDA